MKDSRQAGRPPLIAALVVTCLAFAACGEPDAVSYLATPAGTGSAEPHLALTSAGRPVLSWLEATDEGHALRYSVHAKAGWSPSVDVAQGDDWFVNWADFPSVVPISDSLWAAHWLNKRPGNSYSYDVVMTVSVDGGRSWAEPLTPHDDDTPTEHGFVSLFPWMNAVGALWLDGRNTMTDGTDGETVGMTLRSAVIAADGTVADGQVVDGLVCDCCQTDVAIARDGPVAVYRNRSSVEIRDIYVARTSGGRWTEGVPVAEDGWHIAGCPVNGPAIAADDEQVAVAWFTAAGELPRVRVAFSGDGGETFGPPVDVDAASPVGRVGIVHLGHGDVLVSWLAAAEDGAADVRAMRVSASGARGTSVTIATTAAGRMSGFPQVIRTGDDIIFAWTDATEDGAATKVRSAVAPATLF